MSAYSHDIEKKLKEELNEVFGELTARQLWVLTKFAKRVRTYARSNAAFNNLANRMFPYAKFSQVNKQRKDGTVYPGLSIAIINDNKSDVVSDDDED